MKDIHKKFLKLHHEAEEQDELQMSHSLLKGAIEHLIGVDEQKASELVDIYEGMLHYNNYLTQEEMDEVTAKLENEDGSHGARWTAEEIISKLESIGINPCYEPYYNKYALATMMNIISSDHYNTLAKLSNNNREKFFEVVHELAKEKLTDKDRPIYIRWYVGV